MPEVMPAERHAGPPGDGEPSWPGPRPGALRPFGEFEELLDRLVKRSRRKPARADMAGRRTPVVDLDETADWWVVEVEFPAGTDASQIETQLTDRVLTVRVPRPASRAGGQ
ncbi:MAG TPA: hypothetical protein VIX86_18795 [Streptosporangiaceae bacterium]